MSKRTVRNRKKVRNHDVGEKKKKATGRRLSVVDLDKEKNAQRLCVFYERKRKEKKDRKFSFNFRKYD